MDFNELGQISAARTVPHCAKRDARAQGMLVANGRAVMLGSRRRPGIDCQRVDAVLHQISHRRVDHAMTLDGRLAGKCAADYVHVKMPGTFAGVTDMLVTFIEHLDINGRKGRVQASPDLFVHRLAHAGSALRNGMIRTCA